MSQFEILPAHDRDPEHVRIRRQVSEACRQKLMAGVSACKEDVLQLHCAGMPMSEIVRVTKLSLKEVQKVVSVYLENQHGSK